MKKRIVLFMAALFIFSSLCACSGKAEGPNSAVQSAGAGRDMESGISTGAGANTGAGQNVDDGRGTEGDASSGGLQLLSNRYNEVACSTENGYYYFTTEMTKLRDGGYGSRLMYMDFAAGREIYLCSTAGCGHDSLDCPAVYACDDFPIYSTLPFVWGDQLYILSREYDDDGTVFQEFTFGSEGGLAEKQPAVLYCADLDGTNRRKVFTFDAALTLEDKIIGNDTGIYVIVKRLSSEKDGGEIFTTSSERKLMFLNLDTFALNEVCSMDFGDHISWQIIDCCQNDFLLCGIDYGREISRDELWNDDVYKELYENSFKVYALLSCSGDGPKEIARQSNRYENSAMLTGGRLYLSSRENQNIEALDIKTGVKTTLCALPQNLILDAFGDTLCCRGWNLAEDQQWYFVDTNTGSVAKSPLVNLYNGWSLEFRAETKTDVLFVYDYDATDNHDGSYSVHKYRHALICKDDLFAGKDNYRKIEMIGPGY